MKTIFLPLIWISHIILICCALTIDLHAQTFEEENAKVMERMDTESFKGKVLLNKAIVLELPAGTILHTGEKQRRGLCYAY